MTDGYAGAEKTIAWSERLNRAFSSVDTDGDGFLTKGEMQNCLQKEACGLLTGKPEAEAFNKNFDDIQFASNFSTSFKRGLMGWEGVARSDLEELARRARELPEAMEKAKDVEAVLSKYYQGSELRKWRFDNLVNSPRVNEADREVLRYVQSNWRHFKVDIGNQFNADQALIPSRLPQLAEAQRNKLARQYEPVRKVGESL